MAIESDARLWEAATENLIRQVQGFLEVSPLRAKLCSDHGDLERSVRVNWATWHKWFMDGKQQIGRREIEIPSSRRVAAFEFTDPMTSIGIGGQRTIDRAALVKLARSRAAGDNHLVRLFVATMAWGSGTTNGRGPRNTARALADERVGDALARTYNHIEAGELASAHRVFRVEGIGEAFFTKWFWACSLGHQRVERPLILDLRVRATLWRALATQGWKAPRGEDGYFRYVTLLHDTATNVRDIYPGITAEKIEWLLFDRDDTVCGKPEQSMHQHLGTR